MKLSQDALLHKEELAANGYRMPEYDVKAMVEKTSQEPKWVQLGAGNIFRAFLAADQQQLLNQGLTDTGIIVAEGYDTEIIDILRDYDNLTVNVTLKGDGSVAKEVIASIAEYLKMTPGTEDFERLQVIFRAPSLEMVSMTITEKGYSLVDGQGQVLPVVQADFEQGPKNPQSYLGKLVSLLYERYLAGRLPLALVSMDNMSHNGEKLEQAVSAYVKNWVQNELVDSDFASYLQEQVTFPWTMIDKITPRPDVSVEELLTKDGWERMEPVETSKHTYVAPYVNGEETQYLIIEDQFPLGHPALTETGVIFTDRTTVNKVETMKVTTCLNPLHTALAIFGCLLGYTSIHEEMQDEDLVALIKLLGYQEGLPVVVNPGILDPKEFIDEVITKRFPNPFIPDTPQRIATDTSQKIPVRYGETLKSYVKAADLDVQSLQGIPLVLAGWLRYLTGINDEGKPFAISPDPMLDTLQPLFADFQLSTEAVAPEVQALLQDPKLFGVNLVEIGLADQVLAYYQQMNQAVGAIRSTLHAVVTK